MNHLVVYVQNRSSFGETKCLVYGDMDLEGMTSFENFNAQEEIKL